jgi:hypothetical protein
MTTEEGIRSGNRPGFWPETARPEYADLLAVVIPESRSYQYFSTQQRFLVTSIELWQDRVIVQIACPTAAEAAAVPKLELEDNAGTRYACTPAEVRGNRLMLTYTPAAPKTIRTLSVCLPHPVSDLPSSGFITAVRLIAGVPSGGRIRRFPRPAI